MLSSILNSNTGTRFGYSYWTGFLDCGRANLLGVKHRTPGLSGSEGMDVGTVVHALLAMWYKGEATSFIPLQGTNEYETDVLNEAFRIFRAYTSDHDRLEFGEPLFIEELFRVKDFYHWPVYHIRPDIVFNVTDAVAEEMKLSAGPGLYSVDFKNWGRHAKYDGLYSKWDLRFHCYMEAMKRALPEELSQHYKGNIVFGNFKLKEVDFKRWDLPYTSLAVQRVEALTLASFDARREALRGKVDNRHCVSYMRDSKCRFLHVHCGGY